MAADGLKMERLQQRYRELETPVLGKLPDFKTIKEANDRRTQEIRERAARLAQEQQNRQKEQDRKQQAEQHGTTPSPFGDNYTTRPATLGT